ncbi:MAG: PQQ-dependent sugar dehydrogenase [Mucilaginibacter polytrichastri]|nr:PQQ-dependent sugar dehydrogenase [Mucilaginibacter polytrichastri]
MRPFSLLIFLSLVHIIVSAQTIVRGSRGEKFEQRTLIRDLSDPWSVVCGPDGRLWVTEARGYRVSQVDPETGRKEVLLDLNEKRLFPRYDQMQKETSGKPWPQSGLMGMALHPDLLKGSPYVYLLYVYYFEGADKEDNGCKTDFGGCYFRAKLERYVYDQSSKKLVDPVVLCDTIPQSNDHNGGMLMVAPVGGKNYLFYSIGDMGAGQFDNAGRKNQVQNVRSYEGKILRFNTEPDGDAGSSDRWIPNDNPFNREKQSAVWTLGHRNPQGLAWAMMNGKALIYSSEHGPFSDDEINLIRPGRNYGHPLVIGYADNNYNGLAAGVTEHRNLPGRWNTSYPTITDEKKNAAKIGASYTDPIFSIAPNSHRVLSRLFRDMSEGRETPRWPAEAPSSLEVYTSDAIPGWKNSLLVPTLRGGKLIRIKLSDDGERTLGDTLQYFHARERLRDVATAQDGRTIYFATDSSMITSGPTALNPTESGCRGCIISFTYIAD